MTEPTVRHVQIVIDGTFEGDAVHLTLTTRPMIPTHTIAELLEGAVVQIRAGRLDSIEVRPVEGS